MLFSSIDNKKIKIILNFILEAGCCSNNPNLSTTLGQNGINIKKFTDDFNKFSKDNFKEKLKLRVKVYVFDDRSFSFELLGIPTSILLKKYLLENNSKEKLINFYKSLFIMNISKNFTYNSKKNLPLILKGTLNSFNF